jgi:hypothetical protein
MATGYCDVCDNARDDLKIIRGGPENTYSVWACGKCRKELGGE